MGPTHELMGRECREKLHQSAAYGYRHLSEDEMKVDWPTLKGKRDKYIERLNGIYEKSEYVLASIRATADICVDVEKDGVTKLTGRARFVDANTVSVSATYPASKAIGGSDTERVLTADRIVIAVGGKPTLPSDIEGAELGFDSDGFFDLKDLPKKVVVVGAGYIAVELAGIFHTLGKSTPRPEIAIEILS